MLNQSGSHGGVAFHPLTRDRWSDFEELFGERSACGGASNALTLSARSGEANRSAMKSIVDSGMVPRILVYAGDRPVGW
jgi:hypothetical protein